MGYRFFFIFFVRFPLCKMFVQICFRTDGCCTKFEHVKHSGTDRQPEGHSSIVYITYVHMLRRCVFVPPPLPPHFVSMSLDDDDDDDGYGWATRTHNKPTHNTQHTSTQIDPSFSVSNSISFSLLVQHIQHFGQLCQSRNIVG